jgi:hypothetical protein
MYQGGIKLPTQVIIRFEAGLFLDPRPHANDSHVISKGGGTHGGHEP